MKNGTTPIEYNNWDNTYIYDKWDNTYNNWDNTYAY